jgi:hypothetical protein
VRGNAIVANRCGQNGESNESLGKNDFEEIVAELRSVKIETKRRFCRGFAHRPTKLPPVTLLCTFEVDRSRPKRTNATCRSVHGEQYRMLASALFRCGASNDRRVGFGLIEGGAVIATDGRTTVSVLGPTDCHRGDASRLASALEAG